MLEHGSSSVLLNCQNINENIETKNTEAQQVKQIEIINTVESPVTAIAEKVSPSV